MAESLRPRMPKGSHCEEEEYIFFNTHDKTNKSSEVKLSFLNITSNLELFEGQLDHMPEVTVWLP